jgi:hypothetical protein
LYRQSNPRRRLRRDLTHAREIGDLFVHSETDCVDLLEFDDGLLHVALLEICIEASRPEAAVAQDLQAVVAFVRMSQKDAAQRAASARVGFGGLVPAFTFSRPFAPFPRQAIASIGAFARQIS